MFSDPKTLNTATCISLRVILRNNPKYMKIPFGKFMNFIFPFGKSKRKFIELHGTSYISRENHFRIDCTNGLHVSKRTNVRVKFENCENENN